ncbi:carboxymuconolactone decarboxylase family protein [Chitinibacter sp. ZOR0017]|uniref:carboxymuconolactone decarboxylase family protein n=1 Tax=Chitinibacter sp. ZOR0017 TaxID=1339254 RepID=UPI00064644CE|nr:carboxymuconolactone decarboxylase family protein [Chitinibacter sp. ZOR0017]
MSEQHYHQIVREISGKLREFNQEIPDTAQAFGALTKATHTDGAISKKHKELMAMAIAIAARCQGCLGFHAQACVKLGVTRAEFLEMLQVAVYMGGGPSMMTAAEAMLAYEEYGGEVAAK